MMGLSRSDTISFLNIANKATQPMARSLVARAFQEKGINVVIASCLDEKLARIKVLEKAGMRRLVPDGNMLKWEIRKDNRATARVGQ